MSLNARMRDISLALFSSKKKVTERFGDTAVVKLDELTLQLEYADGRPIPAAVTFEVFGTRYVIVPGEIVATYESVNPYAVMDEGEDDPDPDSDEAANWTPPAPKMEPEIVTDEALLEKIGSFLQWRASVIE